MTVGLIFRGGYTGLRVRRRSRAVVRVGASSGPCALNVPRHRLDHHRGGRRGRSRAHRTFARISNHCSVPSEGRQM